MMVASTTAPSSGKQKIRVAFADYVIDEKFRGCRKYKARTAVDGHQHQPDREQTSAADGSVPGRRVGRRASWFSRPQA